MVDQSDAGSAGIFSWWTNQTASAPPRARQTLRSSERSEAIRTELFGGELNSSVVKRLIKGLNGGRIEFLGGKTAY
eukprot:4779905-Pyramimonas_sp.AAC.1